MQLNWRGKWACYIAPGLCITFALAAFALPPLDGEFSTLASWYGPGFNGRRTASGSRFDENEMTAASKTLPFGTKVLVENPLNGRCCTVTINDRGPYVSGRGLDLSHAAARDLGIGGVGPVVCYINGDMRKRSESTATDVAEPEDTQVDEVATATPADEVTPNQDAAEESAIDSLSTPHSQTTYQLNPIVYHRQLAVRPIARLAGTPLKVSHPVIRHTVIAFHPVSSYAQPKIAYVRTKSYVPNIPVVSRAIPRSNGYSLGNTFVLSASSGASKPDSHGFKPYDLASAGGPVFGPVTYNSRATFASNNSPSVYRTVAKPYVVVHTIYQTTPYKARKRPTTICYHHAYGSRYQSRAYRGVYGASRLAHSVVNNVMAML